MDWIAILRKTLANAARTAACTTSVTPHRLRHTFATTMLRLGVSLPALMQLLGHKDIHMTLLYLDVTQQDLQREFHCARQKAASLHPIPKLPLPQATTPQRVDLPAIRNAIAARSSSPPFVPSGTTRSQRAPQTSPTLPTPPHAQSCS